MMRFISYWLISLCIFCTQLSVWSEAWKKQFNAIVLIGEGEFTVWGFSIYKANLWQETKPFNPNQKFALEITYQKSISRDRFINISLDEIKRIHGNKYSEDQLKQFKAYMSKAFVDVKSGEKLIGVNLGDAGCQFYNQEKLLADIPDKNFTQAFFSIWLDAQTKDKNLRNQLIGNP